MASLNDKVRKARILVTKPEVRIAAKETAARNAKASGINLTPKEETKAAKVLSSRMKLDRQRTASRAVAIEKTQAKKQAAKRVAAATGTASTKKETVKAKPFTGEAAAKVLQKRTSPKGVKEYEKGAKKALEKKYPGLYKKSK